jgi:ABC-type amino acid transport substrate-binding protein
VRYSGADFNGIFDGLAKGSHDCVISGTTITPERATVALFSQPYLEFNQGVAVNRLSTPNVSSLRDLHGLTAGIQSGNTSDFVAKRLLAEGAIAGIKYYPYHGIATALDDLEARRIGLVIKLFPVISWLVKDSSQLSVAKPAAVRGGQPRACDAARQRRICAAAGALVSPPCQLVRARHRKAG